MLYNQIMEVMFHYISRRKYTDGIKLQNRSAADVNSQILFDSRRFIPEIQRYCLVLCFVNINNLTKFLFQSVLVLLSIVFIFNFVLLQVCVCVQKGGGEGCRDGRWIFSSICVVTHTPYQTLRQLSIRCFVPYDSLAADAVLKIKTFVFLI